MVIALLRLTATAAKLTHQSIRIRQQKIQNLEKNPAGNSAFDEISVQILIT
jgi:hypothetical protein